MRQKALCILALPFVLAACGGSGPSREAPPATSSASSLTLGATGVASPNPSSTTAGPASSTPVAPGPATPAAESTPTDSLAFPTSGPVPPSIGYDIIGGAMCATANAWWVDAGGHPEVHVLVPAVAEVSVSFLGVGGELLGTDQAGQVSVGRGGLQLVGTDVRSVDVKAVSLAIAGSRVGSCVVPKV